jgi:hypothetical protein
MLQSLNIHNLLEETEATVSRVDSDNDDCLDQAAYSEDASIDDILEDLSTYLQCLVDLGPSIELSAQDPGLEEHTSNMHKYETRSPFRYYSDLILAKFPRADENIINHLGMLNWERSRRVRDLIEANAEEVDILEVNEATPSIVSRSQFHDSGLGSSLPSHSVYARTMASSFKESISDTSQSRIPPVSEEAKRGAAFLCIGCGRMIQARSTRDYK